MIMKKLISALIFTCAGVLLYAQDNCKVLVKELEGEYKGDCKKGLAHGEGEATGLDTYIGEFKKGLPHGEGKYIYNPGDRTHEGNWKKGQQEGFGVLTVYTQTDTILKEGYWREGEYYSKYEMPYKVTYRMEIKKVSFIKKAEGNTIEFRFTLQGKPNENVREVKMESKTGFKAIIPGTSAEFANCTFPFKGKIEYMTVKKEFSAESQASMYCELQFEIYEPGIWEIVISN